MIDPYSMSVGFVLCAVMVGAFGWGKMVRSKELQRIHEAGANLDVYFSDGKEPEPEKVVGFPRDGRAS